MEPSTSSEKDIFWLNGGVFAWPTQNLEFNPQHHKINKIKYKVK
jgi:hypothetical protein